MGERLAVDNVCASVKLLADAAHRSPGRCCSSYRAPKITTAPVRTRVRICCVDPTESVSNRWHGLATGLETGRMQARRRLGAHGQRGALQRRCRSGRGVGSAQTRDLRRRSVLMQSLQSTHRAQPGIEFAVISFDDVVRILFDDVPRASDELVAHARIDRCPVARHPDRRRPGARAKNCRAAATSWRVETSKSITWPC